MWERGLGRRWLIQVPDDALVGVGWVLRVALDRVQVLEDVRQAVLGIYMEERVSAGVYREV